MMAFDEELLPAGWAWVGGSLSDASSRSPRQFDGGRLDLRFSLSWVSDEGPSDAKEDLDDGRDEDVFVQTVEQVDDRHGVEKL